MLVFPNKEMLQAVNCLLNLRPNFLINAERFSVCARLQRAISEPLKSALFLSNSHCNTGYLTPKLIQSETQALRLVETQRHRFLRVYAAQNELKGKGSLAWCVFVSGPTVGEN